VTGLHLVKANDILFVAFLLGIPVWLVARAWRSYFGLDVNSGGKSFRMRAALVLLSVSLLAWIAIIILMTLEDYSIGLTLAQNLSPMVEGFFNILLCIGAFGCSGVWRTSGGGDKKLKRAIAVASGVLIMMWLLIFLNPH
jgi:hypothetical protein